MKIGIFDSGIGGLTVLYQARKLLPQAQFLYYADEKHVPYGEKSVSEIRGFVGEILQFLVDAGAEAIVIACNTATSVADRAFRSQFPVPIVGMEPAVKRAVEYGHVTGRRILVAATPVTIAGDKLHELLDRVDTGHETDLVSLPKLVRFAEQGDFYTPEVDQYLEERLAGFDLEKYEAVVLGCTHFNYFKENFRRLFPKQIHFVDGNAGTVRQLARVLPAAGAEGTDKGSVTYYFSGVPVSATERERLEKCLAHLEKMYEIV